jgi:hypothetical protein
VLHGIKKRRADYKHWVSETKDNIKQEARRTFINNITDRWVDDQEVWFYDETTIQLWDMQGRRLWMRVTKRIPITIVPTRITSYTILGAISNYNKELVYRITSETTNKEEVLEFLKHLKRNMVDPGNSVIVMDNHRAHHAHVVSAYLDSEGIDY